MISRAQVITESMERLTKVINNLTDELGEEGLAHPFTLHCLSRMAKMSDVHLDKHIERLAAEWKVGLALRAAREEGGGCR
jgi:hypothetical protein